MASPNWAPLLDAAVKLNKSQIFNNSWEKKLFTPVFGEWKVQELCIAYFHSKLLVDINLRNFLKIQNFR